MPANWLWFLWFYTAFLSEAFRLLESSPVLLRWSQSFCLSSLGRSSELSISNLLPIGFAFSWCLSSGRFQILFPRRRCLMLPTFWRSPLVWLWFRHHSQHVGRRSLFLGSYFALPVSIFPKSSRHFACRNLWWPLHPLANSFWNPWACGGTPWLSFCSPLPILRASAQWFRAL